MRRIALPALLIATLAAGCGDGSTKTATQVTKAEYIEVADAICANHRSRREDLESQAADLGPLSSPAKARRVAALLREESRNLEAEARELEARPAPAADRDELATLIAIIRARADAIDRWAGAYDDLDEPAIRRLQIRVGLLTARAERVGSAYGFSTCGR